MTIPTSSPSSTTGSFDTSCSDSVSAATVTWVGPEGTERYDVGNAVFENESFQDEDGSLDAAGPNSYLILNDEADQLVLTLNISQASFSNLQPGQEAEIRITGESGAASVIQISVPQSLAGESSVSV